MKVLLIVHGYPPTAVGGTELYAAAHARTLRRDHQDEVTVLTRECDPSRDEYAVRSEHRDGVRVVAINNTYRNTRNFAETYANPAIGRVADRILDQIRPDVAHIHHLTHLSTSLVASLEGRDIPVLMTLHDYWLICHRGQLLDAALQVCDGPEERGCGSCLGLAGSIGTVGFVGASTFRILERSLPASAASGLRHAAEGVARLAGRDAVADDHARERQTHMRRVCSHITHFFAPSRFIRERFIRFGVPAERITYSPYGLEHQAFPRKRRSKKAEGGLRVGFFGSLMVSKAPHLLIEAAAHLPAETVAVELAGPIAPYHGDDSYRSVIQRMADRDGVTIRGAIAHERMGDALDAVDAVVVPSIWPENSPFVIHEAFLAGVPVVASRIGGIPELIEHGRNGLLFEPGDASDLARQLARLVSEPELVDALREGAPSVRTIEDDVAQMRQWYRGRPQPSGARLAALVLNFHTPDETLLAVRALLQSDRRIDNLIVVNNGRDDSLETLRAALQPVAPAISLLHAGENLGFSGGMNKGIEMALAQGADYVMLVNSDVIVPPDCVGRLERALADTPNAGIVGPVMAARTDPGTIASLGIGYAQSTGRMRHRLFGSPMPEAPFPRTQEVDAVSGCVMLIARKVLDAVGLLDEAYFFSFEDVDFCLRAKRAGFTSAIAGDARVYHEGHRSIGQATPSRLYFAARNHLRLASRVNGSAAPFGLWAVPIVALNVAHAFRATGGSLPARLGAVVRGVWDYARGRFGAGAESDRLMS